jgi:hypothetical protein
MLSFSLTHSLSLCLSLGQDAIIVSIAYHPHSCLFVVFLLCQRIVANDTVERLLFKKRGRIEGEKD